MTKNKKDPYNVQSRFHDAWRHGPWFANDCDIVSHDEILPYMQENDTRIRHELYRHIFNHDDRGDLFLVDPYKINGKIS